MYIVLQASLITLMCRTEVSIDFVSYLHSKWVVYVIRDQITVSKPKGHKTTATTYQLEQFCVPVYETGW